MCGRVFQTYDINQLLVIAGTNIIQNSDKYTPSYNIAPGEYVPVIKHINNPEENNRVVDIMKWGYQPFQTLLFNARSEKPHKKKTFKPLIDSRRCVIMVEGYFEWTAERVPYVFRPKMKMSQSQTTPLHLLIAGIYAHDGTVILLTRNSIGDAKKAHSRMPVLLDDSEIDMWLNCEKNQYQDIQSEILDDEKDKWKSIFCYQLTPLVNNSKNKSEKVLMKSDEYDTGAEKATIKKFFSSGKKSTQVTHDDPFEGLKRADEESDVEDEDFDGDFSKEETKVEEVKSIASEKKSVEKIKIELNHSPIKKKVDKGTNSKKKEIEEVKNEEGKRYSENSQENKELVNIVEDIKAACEEAGIDLGKGYKVRQTLVVVEKKEDENKENVEKGSKAKKRKSYEGEQDNAYLPAPKKMKQSPNPLGQRN